MTVSKIFESIQGEGAWLGVPAIFVRFHGCNLACDFCDENKHEFGQEVSVNNLVNELVRRMERTGWRHIVLTGGEPLIQPGIAEVVEKLLNYDPLEILQIETNGTTGLRFEHPYHYKAWASCSPKEVNEWKIHDELYRYIKELKYVVTEKLTAENIYDVIKDFRHEHYVNIWLQPMWLPATQNRVDLNSLVKAIKMTKEDNTFRLGFQAHKYWNIE